MSSVLVFKSALYPTTERKFNKAQATTKNGTRYKLPKEKIIKILQKTEKDCLKTVIKPKKGGRKGVEAGFLFSKTTLNHNGDASK